MVRLMTTDQVQYGVSTAAADGIVVDFLVASAPIYTGTAKVYFDGVLQSSGLYTINEALGLISFTVAPTAGVTVTISYQFTCLTDQNITDLLAMYVEDDSIDAIRLTSADCLDIIASSEAMIQKLIKSLDFETNGPAVAKSLRDQAATLRDLVFDPKYQTPAFDFAQQINDKPGWKEKIVKDILRQNG